MFLNPKDRVNSRLFEETEVKKIRKAYRLWLPFLKNNRGEKTFACEMSTSAGDYRRNLSKIFV